MQTIVEGTPTRSVKSAIISVVAGTEIVHDPAGWGPLYIVRRAVGTCDLDRPENLGSQFVRSYLYGRQ